MLDAPAGAAGAGAVRGSARIALVLVLAAGGVFAAICRCATPTTCPSGPARAGVERLTTPVIERPPVQEVVGPLPDPPGAARVDLARPALLPNLYLVPAPAAGMAFDLADGRVLWRDGATRVRPIASLTKLMTGLLAVERFGKRNRVRITEGAPQQVEMTHMGGLNAGRRVRAEVLLQGLMIQSGNDAAVALAIGGAGSERAWVQRMNRRAKLLGLRCTHFADASGLDPRNRSCPADLAALAMRAMAEPRLRRIARKRWARVWPGAGKKITLRTTNHLLRERYPGRDRAEDRLHARGRATASSRSSSAARGRSGSCCWARRPTRSRTRAGSPARSRAPGRSRRRRERAAAHVPRARRALVRRRPGAAVGSRRVLREITDGALVRERLTPLGWRWSFARGATVRGPAWSTRRVRAIEAAQLERPVALVREGRRCTWLFEERFYVADDGLGERDVLALVRERERRARRTLERAHATLARDGEDAPPPAASGSPPTCAARSSSATAGAAWSAARTSTCSTTTSSRTASAARARSPTCRSCARAATSARARRCSGAGRPRRAQRRIVRRRRSLPRRTRVTKRRAAP